MTETTSGTTAEISPLVRLAAPGERFGWIFQDRNLYRRRFLEPSPTPTPVPPHLLEAVNSSRTKMAGRMVTVGGITLGLLVVVACCGSFAASGSSGGGVALTFLLGVIALAGVAGIVGVWWMHQSAKNALERKTAELRAQYQQAFAAWDQRRQVFEAQQQQFVDSLFEWGAATPSPGTRRVDIIGGTTWGWEAVLTIFGASLLRTRGPMTVVDFSGETLGAELLRLCGEVGATTNLRYVPSQLAEVDLVAGLDHRQLVDCLVEAMHGDSTSGGRADRAQDTMLLTELCEAIGENVTLARLAAGLRVLTDRPGTPALTPEECGRVLDSLPDETRRQLLGNVRRVEAFLRPLETMGTAPTASTAVVTCIAADRDGRSAQHELLKDLIVQWLIRRVSNETVTTGSLVVVGADEIDHRHVERLGSLCERRGVRLVLLFQHLRESSLHAIGGGEVAFMRLPNHEEARQAAEFIGRHHKFALSQLTRTLGGNDTHTIADTEGFAETEGKSWGSTSGGPHYTTNRSQSFSRTRNWSQTVSVANGTNWSDAASAQRVYEYAVEPRVLQDLPDYAMLLVKSQDRGSVVQAVECDPAIVLLPRMTLEPLPAMALPDRTEAAIPVSGLPTQLTVSAPQPIAPLQQGPNTAAGPVMPGWGTGNNTGGWGTTGGQQPVPYHPPASAPPHQQTQQYPPQPPRQGQW